MTEQPQNGNILLPDAKDDQTPADRTLRLSSDNTATATAIIDAEKQTATLDSSNPIIDPPPNGGYGWVIAAAQFFVIASIWGPAACYGIFLSYYRQNKYFPGATDLDFAFVGGLTCGAPLWVAPLSNYLAKTYHFKVPMYIGTFIFVLSHLLAAFSTRIWELYLTQGLMFGVGIGLIFVPTLPLLSQWFTTKRGLAVGITTAGAGGGSLLLSFITHAAIANLSLKWAFIINGIVVLVVLVPSISILRDRGNMKFEPLQHTFWFHRGYIWVWLWGFFSLAGYIVALFTLATFSTAGLHFTQSQGSNLTAFLALGQMIGRPVIGVLLDRWGVINSSALGTFLAGLGCLFIWIFGRSYGVLIFFSIFQGIFGGIFWVGLAPVSVKVVGLRDLGSAMAIAWITVAPAGFTAEPIALALNDYSISHLGLQGADAYLISIAYAGGAYIVAALLLLGAKRHVQGNWKIFRRT